MTDEPYMKYDPLSDTFHFHTEDQDTELSFDDDFRFVSRAPPQKRGDRLSSLPKRRR